jgi:hypothetical protein
MEIVEKTEGSNPSRSANYSINTESCGVKKALDAAFVRS